MTFNYVYVWKVREKRKNIIDVIPVAHLLNYIAHVFDTSSLTL